MKRMDVLLCSTCLAALCAGAMAWAAQPAGIVFESEAISRPEAAWKLNERTADHWMLWTQEEDIAAKRSGGAVLASPSVEADRATPEEGAPPLHSVATGLDPGTYRVFVSAPGRRPLAYSLDGHTWRRHAGGELCLGTQALPAGQFELWVDDRYAHPPDSPGAGYYDYVRFERVPDSARNVKRFAIQPERFDSAFTADGRGAIVPAAQLSELSGFELENGKAIRGEKKGASFSYVFDHAGQFYLGVYMNDDEDGVEELVATLNGQELGCIVADERPEWALYSFVEPVDAKAGDRLTFTCAAPVGCYRIGALYFGAAPVEPAAPTFEHITAWSTQPGHVDICWITSDIVETGELLYGTGEPNQRAPREAYRGRNHRIRLRGLDPAATFQGRIRTTWNGEELLSAPFTFSAAPVACAPTQSLDIALAVPEPTPNARRAWPATIGVPFAKGVLADPADLHLFAPNGAPLALQGECGCRWPDGSVKWATLSFLADTGVDAPATYHVKGQATWPEPAPGAAPTLAIQDAPEAWLFSTGALAFDVPKKRPALFYRVGYDRNGDGAVAEDERIQADALGANVRIVDGDGAFLTCGPPDGAGPRIESNGAARALVAWSGPMLSEQGASGWQYMIRLSLWKGLSALGVTLSFWNDQAEPAYRSVRTIGLRIPMDAAGGVRGTLDGGALEAPPDVDGLWIQQDKDNHCAIRNVAGLREIDRGGGLATAVDDRARIHVVFRDFREAYPSGFAIKSDGIHVRLLPQLAPDAYHEAESAPWFYKLYAWCKEGQYLFRAGQLIQRQVFVHYSAPDRPAEAWGAWLAQPLLPQADPGYLCATGVLGGPIFARTPGVWETYERAFDQGFEKSLADRDTRRTYGWMHYGDWYGERICNFGNNEYDLAWALGVQWMRTGDRRFFERGLDMARHHTTVDTIHGSFTDALKGLVWEHCFNHVGTGLSLQELRIPPEDPDFVRYEKESGRMLQGALDPQGHVFEQGAWLYAALTGDPWLRDVAERVCAFQAERLTPAFSFGIERCGGWPLINASTAYSFTGDPYYLNAARLMIERTLERQDPASGGWLHTPPLGETDGKPVVGGKAFAVGILTHGVLCYLQQEPADRPEVRRMLVRGADWLMNEAWNPGKGFRYITNAPNYADTGSRAGCTSYLCADVVAFAAQETKDPKYLAFWKDMMAGTLDSTSSGMGKSFTQATRQTVFGLERMHQLGVVALP